MKRFVIEKHDEYDEGDSEATGHCSEYFIWCYIHKNRIGRVAGNECAINKGYYATKNELRMLRDDLNSMELD